jgi:hypothetical protein
MTPVGRETMDAIEAELGMKPRKERSRPLRSRASAPAPEISIEQGPVGRETLAAIAEEARMLGVDSARDTLDTIPYEDRVPNAPGAVSPSNPPSARRKTGPLNGAAPAPFAEGSELEIFEMMTFVIRNPAPSELSSDPARRRFVERRLSHRLPRGGETNVARVDVTPWTERDTVIVRVWCKLDSDQ